MATGTQAIGIMGSDINGGGNMAKSARTTGITVLAATLFVVGVLMSMALPYGVGAMVFFFMIAFCGAIYAVGVACFGLMRELMGRHVAFGYRPVEAYMAGKKTRKQADAAPKDAAHKDAVMDDKDESSGDR